MSLNYNLLIVAITKREVAIYICICILLRTPGEKNKSVTMQPILSTEVMIIVH